MLTPAAWASGQADPNPFRVDRGALHHRGRYASIIFGSTFSGYLDDPDPEDDHETPLGSTSSPKWIPITMGGKLPNQYVLPYQEDPRFKTLWARCQPEVLLVDPAMPWSIPLQGLRICEMLGRGGKGAVYKAEFYTFDSTFGWTRDKLHYGTHLAAKISHGNYTSYGKYTSQLGEVSNHLVCPWFWRNKPVQDGKKDYFEKIYFFLQIHPQSTWLHSHDTDHGQPEAVPLTIIGLEYLPGGSIRDRAVARGIYGLIVQDSEALEFFQDLLDAIEQCYRNGIIHHDIKGDNICYDAKGQLKLIDFGYCNHIKGESDEPLIYPTCHYRAPEIAELCASYRNQISQGPSSIRYSAGVLNQEKMIVFTVGRTFAELLGGLHEDWRDIFQDDDIPLYSRDFLSHLVAEDPRDRPDLVQTLELYREWIWRQNTSVVPADQTPTTSVKRVRPVEPPTPVPDYFYPRTVTWVFELNDSDPSIVKSAASLKVEQERQYLRSLFQSCQEKAAPVCQSTLPVSTLDINSNSYLDALRTAEHSNVDSHMSSIEDEKERQDFKQALKDVQKHEICNDNVEVKVKTPPACDIAVRVPLGSRSSSC